MTVARAITSGRSFLASIRIPSNGLDHVKLPSIAASPMDRLVFRTRFIAVLEHGS